jgi:acetoacetate decarboxylase
MKASDVRKTAYSMPLTSPAYPKGPYRFFNREFLVITYRTDPEKLRAVVPEPLEILTSLSRSQILPPQTVPPFAR